MLGVIIIINSRFLLNLVSKVVSPMLKEYHYKSDMSTPFLKFFCFFSKFFVFLLVFFVLKGFEHIIVVAFILFALKFVLLFLFLVRLLPLNQMGLRFVFYNKYYP